VSLSLEGTTKMAGRSYKEKTKPKRTKQKLLEAKNEGQNKQTKLNDYYTTGHVVGLGVWVGGWGGD
jgi:N-acetylmuramoyl-L-alanine amidase CwlA